MKAVQYVEKGKAAYKKQNYEAAVLHFKTAIQAQPRAAEPYYELALAYLALGDFNLAYANLRKATELNPKLAPAQLKLAELMSTSRSQEILEQALKISQDVVAMLPADADALNVLAMSELRLGKQQSAEAHLEEALRNSPANLQSAIILAQTRLARKDTGGAEQVLKNAAEQSPKSPEPRFQLGGFCLALGKTAEAEQEYRRALAIDPAHGPSMLALAGIKVRAGDSAQAESLYREIATLPEKQYKPVYALYLFQSGRHAEALAEFEKLVRADPQDRNLRTQLVTAHLSLNQVDAAKKILADALRNNSRDVDALIQRSRISVAMKQYTDAQNDLNQILRFRPNSPEAHYLLSKVGQSRGEDGMQRQELNETLRLDPMNLLARVDLAQSLLATRGAEQALKVLDQAPPETRDAPALVLQRNWALLALGRSDEARKGIDQVLTVKTIDGTLQDGVLKLRRRDFAGARSDAESILAEAPGELRALSLLVQSYMAEGRLSTGVQKAREHAAKQPNSAAMQLFVGQLLEASEDRTGARRAFEAARAAAPNAVDADLALAVMDSADGQLDAARSRLASVLAAHPDNVQARILSAQTDAAQGKTTQAIDQYRKILQADANNVNALNNLGFLLAEAGQADEALAFAQRAKQLTPDAASVDDTLGWTYYKKGMYPLAVTYLRSSVGRQSNARRQSHLAMACAKAGDAACGQQALDAAVKADPNLPETQQARQLVGASPKK